MGVGDGEGDLDVGAVAAEGGVAAVVEGEDVVGVAELVAGEREGAEVADGYGEGVGVEVGEVAEGH